MGSEMCIRDRFIMILTLAAAEVAVGLGLILQMFRQFKTIDIDVLSEMKG